MESIPLEDVIQGASREPSLDDAIVDAHGDFAIPVSRVEVGRGVIVVGHRDHDTEKPQAYALS